MVAHIMHGGATGQEKYDLIRMFNVILENMYARKEFTNGECNFYFDKFQSLVDRNFDQAMTTYQNCLKDPKKAYFALMLGTPPDFLTFNQNTEPPVLEPDDFNPGATFKPNIYPNPNPNTHQEDFNPHGTYKPIYPDANTSYQLMKDEDNEQYDPYTQRTFLDPPINPYFQENNDNLIDLPPTYQYPWENEPNPNATVPPVHHNPMPAEPDTISHPREMSDDKRGLMVYFNTLLAEAVKQKLLDAGYVIQFRDRFRGELMDTGEMIRLEDICIILEDAIRTRLPDIAGMLEANLPGQANESTVIPAPVDDFGGPVLQTIIPGATGHYYKTVPSPGTAVPPAFGTTTTTLPTVPPVPGTTTGTTTTTVPGTTTATVPGLPIVAPVVDKPKFKEPEVVPRSLYLIPSQGGPIYTTENRKPNIVFSTMLH